MLSSLFDKKTAKQFDKIAEEKAKVHQKEVDAAKDFMATNSSKMITLILDIAEKNGHPTEQDRARELRNKYNEYELEFDDIMTLNALYKSNYRFFENKEETNE